ncbi:MAG: pyridoxal-phosphate dependent enzyme [Actinomycetota bacterium]|nr:pyridoxal-phosphate dependent enzyme [Actinomycetota bacterium]
MGIHRCPLLLSRAPSRFHPPAQVTIADEYGGFALGGNKVRQVDVLLARALSAGADSVVTSAGPQSNFCRVIAAGARAAGLDAYLVLRGHGLPERPQGNQRLYVLSGADLTWVDTEDPLDDAQDEAMRELAEQLRQDGRKPAVIDIRAAEAGLVCAAASTAIVSELAATAELPDRIVMAAGSGNTAAGVLAAICARRAASTRVRAVATAIESERLRPRILARARDVLSFADLDPDLVQEDLLEIDGDQLGEGHGKVTSAARDAQVRTAQVCGVFLDTTYTAKAMASLLADSRGGSVVFIHSGGTPTIFT